MLKGLIIIVKKCQECISLFEHLEAKKRRRAKVLDCWSAYLPKRKSVGSQLLERKSVGASSVGSYAEVSECPSLV